MKDDPVFPGSVDEDIRKDQKKGTESVFTFVNEGRGRKKAPSPAVVRIVVANPVKNIKTSFTSALRRAGISDCKFHDLRHTFASHMIMRGASLKELQEILGHKTMTMTLRYAHLSQEHKKMAVNLLNGLTAREKCHKTVTNEENADSISTPHPGYVPEIREVVNGRGEWI